MQNTLFPSQKKNVVICPEMGEDNAFLNDKSVCFEKWIYWDDKSTSQNKQTYHLEKHCPIPFLGK